uniref:Uncharacterized protein n=1 Tax=Anguilla anguilla TaxID=7936 RepID=A0A0E9PI52_ANGAN
MNLHNVLMASCPTK